MADRNGLVVNVVFLGIVLLLTSLIAFYLLKSDELEVTTEPNLEVTTTKSGYFLPKFTTLAPQHQNAG